MVAAQLLAGAFIVVPNTLVLKPNCVILRRPANQYRSIIIRAAVKPKAATPPPVGKGKKPPQTNAVLMATTDTRSSLTVMSESSENKKTNKGQTNIKV
ncbi:hypothetical protein BVC80_1601g38 [Macleaya cordata]|uniref:Uncharacterized protein n=1 Tax=Macleaya cordata TaxID=56857 RepID=A0A200QA52_MACCD|nr:hypothetical protein BVC80_1601g38 [Macleaya cordata]